MRERLLDLLGRLRTAISRLGSPRTLAIAGYAAFFFLAFLVAAYLTFPWDRLRDYVIQEVERPAGPGGARVPSGWELDIVDLSPAGLAGVTAEGVRIAKRPEVPGEGPQMELVLDRVDAHASVFGLLTGSPGGSLDATLAGGDVSLAVSGNEDARDIDLELSGVQLRRIGLLRAFLPVPVVGRISGDVDVTLTADRAETTGTVDFTIEGLTAGDGQAKLPVPGMGDGITLERLDAGDLDLEATIEEGVADITTLAADGTDLTLAGDGNLRLGTPLDRSILDLLLYVKFKDAYRDRNDRTRALFSLLEVSPQLTRARTPDGGLQFELGGPLGGRLRASPAGSSPPPGG